MKTVLKPDHTYTYGTGTIDRYEFSRATNKGQWIRYDRYTPTTANGESGISRVFVRNESDRTPIHLDYPKGYNSDCSCCYLNITHSEALHQQSLEQQIQSK